MCSHKSLSYFLDEIQREALWQEGNRLTGLNFKFEGGETLLIAKRTTEAGHPQVAFIYGKSAREVMRELWRSTTHKRSHVKWQADKFST